MSLGRNPAHSQQEGAPVDRHHIGATAITEDFKHQQGEARGLMDKGMERAAAERVSSIHLLPAPVVRARRAPPLFFFRGG